MVCLTRSGLKIKQFFFFFYTLSFGGSKNMHKYQTLKILGRGWSKLIFDMFIFREILFWSDL